MIPISYQSTHFGIHVELIFSLFIYFLLIVEIVLLSVYECYDRLVHGEVAIRKRFV